VAEELRQFVDWARESSARYQRWFPLVASALTLLSGFCKGPLRFTILAIAIVLFISVAADFARSLLEKETGYASFQGPPKVVPVTPIQIALATLFACIYTGMIFTGMHLLFLPAGLGFLVMLPCTFVLSYLAAWRNVRNWYRHAMDYEEALNEDAQAHDVHVSPGPLQ
jgi:hypothetical protein